ncbi:chorismate mutase family protein [Rhodococcus qingshengii]|uniref:chorismate mutase family protein n=1 Tax=Rhodococcus qingshengii TaxID=334542 RepID=UPI00311CD70B
MTIVEHLPERRWSVGVPVSGGGLRSGHHIVDLASRRAPGGLVEGFLTTTSSEAGTQTSSYPDEAEGLDSFRRDLDAIDALLLETVRQRLELCLRIGEWKRSREVPMMQPGRVRLVQERAREFARRHDLSPDFFNALYELMIAETCRLEDLVINAPVEEEDTVRESVGPRSGSST